MKKLKHKSEAPSPAVVKALRALLNYNWDREREDYIEMDGPEGHVFAHMIRINNWVEGKKDKPEDVIKEAAADRSHNKRQAGLTPEE